MSLSKIRIVLLLHNEHIPQPDVSLSRVRRQKERDFDVGAVDRRTNLSLVTKPPVSVEKEEYNVCSWRIQRLKRKFCSTSTLPMADCKRDLRPRDCFSNGVWFCYAHTPTNNLQHLNLSSFSPHLPRVSLVSNVTLDNAKRLDSFSSALNIQSCASPFFFGKWSNLQQREVGLECTVLSMKRRVEYA